MLLVQLLPRLHLLLVMSDAGAVVAAVTDDTAIAEVHVATLPPMAMLQRKKCSVSLQTYTAQIPSQLSQVYTPLPRVPSPYSPLPNHLKQLSSCPNEPPTLLKQRLRSESAASGDDGESDMPPIALYQPHAPVASQHPQHHCTTSLDAAMPPLHPSRPSSSLH